MSWYYRLVRIGGAFVPGTAPLLQAANELEQAEFDRRLRAFEDPISHLHPKVPEVSRILYDVLASSEELNPAIELEEEQYRELRPALNRLEAEGLIQGRHTLFKRFRGGLRVSDPGFMLYLYACFGDPVMMERIEARIEDLGPNGSLKGRDLREEYGVPLPFIQALFRVYEARGQGILSKTTGASHYFGK